MPLGSKTPCRVIGCDVGKKSIAICDSGGRETGLIDNTPLTLATLAASLDATYFVVCEATGGHEAALLNAMVDACARGLGSIQVCCAASAGRAAWDACPDI